MIKLDVLSSNELSIFSIMYLNLLKIKVYEKKIRSTHVLFYSHYPKLIWFFFFNLFFFWLHWVFVAVHGLFLVVASGGCSLLWCAGFSLWWLLLSRSMGSRVRRLHSCGTRAQ